MAQNDKKYIPIVRRINKSDDTNTTIADTITLDETGRHRRRMKLTSDGGIEFLLDLPNAQLLNHGDALELNDGRFVLVQAQIEELLEVRGTDSIHLLKLAWQLGNRHLATQINAESLLIRYDEVIADMLTGLGADLRKISAPFSPQGGAYDNTPHEH